MAAGKTADGLRCSLLTLCTPWQGTRIARLLPAVNLSQMPHHSAWGKARLRRPDFPAMSMYSAHDNVVIPYTSGIVEHIDSAELHALGHLSVLFAGASRLLSLPAVDHEALTDCQLQRGSNVGCASECAPPLPKTVSD